MYKFKLSIIVPVYNVEKYLKRCVDSLYKQNLNTNNFEVILINDGSTDHSLEIATQLKKEHDNILLLSQPNAGLAAARNTGLSNIQGEYILFVDSDDYLLPNSINSIIDISEKNNLDVCSFTMKVYKENGSDYVGLIQPFEKYVVYSGEYVLLNGVIIASVCANMYSHDFIKKNDLTFTVGITHEDVDFNNRMYSYAQRIMFTDICSYVYFWNEESLNRSNDENKIRKAFLDDLVIAANTKRFAMNAKLSPKLKMYYINRTNSITISFLLSLFKRKDISNALAFEGYRLAKSLKLYPIKGKTQSWKTTMISVFINTRFYYYIMYIYRHLIKK